MNGLERIRKVCAAWMNGPQRIRKVCVAWYCLCLLPAASVLLFLAFSSRREADDIRLVFLGVPLWILGTIPFVMLMHLLAAIWETLGRIETKLDPKSKGLDDAALESSARTATTPRAPTSPMGSSRRSRTLLRLKKRPHS